MKTILIKCYSPQDVGIEDEMTFYMVKHHCMRAIQYDTEAEALWAYAESPCWYSTIKDAEENWQEFVDECVRHILAKDWDWLEENFV